MEIAESTKAAVELLLSAEQLLITKTQMHNVGEVTVVGMELPNADGDLEQTVIAILVEAPMFDLLEISDEPPTVFDVQDRQQEVSDG
jgi:hypothetical protein